MNQADQHLQLFIRHLTTAAANASLYQLEHLQVQRLCRQALEQAKLIFDNHNSLTLKVVDGRLIFDNHPVAENLSVQRLLDALEKLGISHLQIDPGVYSEELLSLVGALCKRPERLENLCDTEHIRFRQVELSFRKKQLGSTSTRFLGLAEIADYELDRLMEIYDTVRSKQKLNLKGLNEIVDSFIHEFSSHSDAFLAIAPLRSMDEYTYTHSTNICLLNLAQARLLGVEGPLLNEIGIAAMLHDVGKMFIPAEILSKSGKLTDEEWEIMQQHPRLGAEYLLGTPGVPRLAVVTAFEHHMRYDGAGYPQTGRSWPQNVSSYMTAISDTYDAMRTHRAYEESLSFNQIVAIMQKLAGNKLHPSLTHSFLATLQQLEKPAEA